MATTGGVEKLKALLFDSEAKTLTELTQRVDQVFSRAGTQERFQDSVADVLDGALRTAEVSRHAELSSAVAPLIVRTIKTEIRNSQDELVEAIYPMTGRIVQAYVTSAIRDLANDINRRFALNPVMLRVRSLITGKSVAELVIAATQNLKLDELYLIRRGSGELLARWPAPPTTRQGRDHVMSGVLAAINEYSTGALQDNGAALRQIDFGERRLYLRASPVYLLAAKCSGTAAAPIEAILDDAFLSAIEELHKAQRLAEGLGGAAGAARTIPLQDIYQDIEKRVAKSQAEIAGRGVSPAKVLAWGTGLALVAWLTWSAYASYLENKAHDIAANVIREYGEVAGYPIRISVGPLGRSVTVEGLTPNDASKDAVIEKLEQAMPAVEIRNRLRALPNELAVIEPKVETVRQDVVGLRPEIAGVRDQVSALEADAARRGIQSALDRSARRLDEVVAELAPLGTAGEGAADIGAAVAAVAKGREDLAQIRSAAAHDRGPEPASAVPAALDIGSRLRQAGVSLSGLLSKGAGSASSSASPEIKADDMGAAVEALAEETERLARIAVAVAQVVTLKRNLPPPPGPTPRERLEAWTRTHAIFFGKDTEYRDEARAERIVDELAALMRETMVLVRVVGYTDVKGGAERNTPLSMARAEKVVAALRARGIPAARLSGVGREDNADLSSIIGETSPNRRVEFEVGFEGEGVE